MYAYMYVYITYNNKYNNKCNTSIWICKWWCDKQQVDTFRYDPIKILDILAFLVQKGYIYMTIGCHQSPISAFRDYVDGTYVSQHPEVCALVSGMFNNRQAQPRYT